MTARRQSHQAVADVVRAVETDDLDLLFSAFEHLHREYLWQEAFRALVRRRVRPSPRLQWHFVDIYSTFGIGVSRQLLTDKEAVAALRLLLPAYAGPSMQLYRGESAWNHGLRAYGLSWTPDRGVAEGHARYSWQPLQGGAVLLVANVPARAIISAPALLEDAPYLARTEKQFIVDRRRLRNVRVLQHFAQEDWAPPWRLRWPLPDGLA